ncbi:MAG: ABC transporter substrate-binding protein [Deltaproteobacteria bacterium]|nr:ABC transporter substrate-binding protein [Deltaproteobacteria bacterium]
MGIRRMTGTRCLNSWGAFALMAGVLAVSLLAMPLQDAEARDIKVGIIDCYSGPPAVYAEDALNGFKLALEEINEEGVLGGKITWTNRDTKFKVDIALNMAKELVMREEVDLLVGTINSGAAMAVSTAVAEKNKVPFFVWIAKSERITGEKGHRYVFQTGENSAMAGKAGGVALSRKPYVKYWIAGDDYEYGHSIADAAWRNLKARKPEVEMIGKSWWKPGEPDLAPYITSIMSAKPDAVIFATGGRSMTNVLKAIKTTGMAEKFPIWIHTGTDHAVLKPLGEQAPEGVMGTMDYHFYYPETPEHQAFVDKFRETYGGPPGFPAFHGYITAHFIAKAYRKAGSADTEKFIDALEGMTIESPVGRLEMRACDHQVKLPMYLGVTKISEEYGVAVSTDIQTLTGDEVLPTCEEIQEARGN